MTLAFLGKNMGNDLDAPLFEDFGTHFKHDMGLNSFPHGWKQPHDFRQDHHPLTKILTVVTIRRDNVFDPILDPEKSRKISVVSPLFVQK